MRISILVPVLRVFFRLLYHEMAWTYDAVAWGVSAGLWSHWIEQVVPYAQGPMILELGHGPGHLQVAFSRKGYKAFGLDASRQMGRLAYPRIHKFLSNPTTPYGYAKLPRLVHGQAQSIPFPPASMNSVIATFPTEYIFDPATLSEIYRLLVPGGRLVILTTGWITGRRLHQRAAAALFRVTGQSGEWYPGWSQAFRQAGFQVDADWIQLPSSRVFVILGQKPTRTDPVRGT